MRRNSLVLAFAVIFVAVGSMGSECQPIETGTDGGVETDAGTDGGTAGSCIDTGTCDPNAYSDTSNGDYDTSNYPLLALTTGAHTYPDTADNKDGDISLINGYAANQQISYWLLSPVNAQIQLKNIFPNGATFVNRVYVILDRDSGAKIGHAILDTAPDSENYSPILQVINVYVPSSYVDDTIKSEATLTEAINHSDTTGITMEATNKLYVIQMVDKSVGLAEGGGPDDPVMEQAWFNGFAVYGYSIPGGLEDGSMIAVNLSDDPAQTPPDPYLSELWQFNSGSSVCAGRNVYGDAFGGQYYSPVPVLHYYAVPDCASIPQNADDVISKIGDGTYTQSGSDITVVTPINPS